MLPARHGPSSAGPCARRPRWLFRDRSTIRRRRALASSLRRFVASDDSSPCRSITPPLAAAWTAASLARCGDVLHASFPRASGSSESRRRRVNRRGAIPSARSSVRRGTFVAMRWRSVRARRCSVGIGVFSGDRCESMRINAHQCESMHVNANQCESVRVTANRRQSVQSESHGEAVRSAEGRGRGGPWGKSPMRGEVRGAGERGEVEAGFWLQYAVNPFFKNKVNAIKINKQ